jgi:hypothetical protein
VPGRHEPLVSEALFAHVQALLASRKRRMKTRHRFLFSQLVICACGCHLYGEIQKSHTYYRCHGEFCENLSSVREEAIEAAVIAQLIQSFGSDHMVTVAWKRAETFQKRMLAEHLGMKIQVQKKLVDVALTGGDFEQSTWQSHLSRILNEILLKPANFRPFAQIAVNN